MRLPSGQDISVGQVCTSTEHHLILRQELTYPATNGQTIHTLMEYYDVQLGAEPDPKLFDIAHTFTVYDAAVK